MDADSLAKKIQAERIIRARPWSAGVAISNGKLVQLCRFHGPDTDGSVVGTRTAHWPNQEECKK